MAATNILVVEDEDALATLLQYNLEKEGYRITVASDGEEAMTLAQEQPPDLVVLDWMLPKVSGIEVCRRLRARTETRNLPIIIEIVDAPDRIEAFMPDLEVMVGDGLITLERAEILLYRPGRH